MSEILRLSYDADGTLNLTLYDPDTEKTCYVTAVDVEVINMLAVDAAFERRTPVRIEVDEYKHIIRVETLGPAPEQPAPEPPVPGGVVITRIATQRQEPLIAEIFFRKDPPGETPSRTAYPLMHTVCHGAFLSKRRVQITLDADQYNIKRVVKGPSDPT